MTSRSVSLAYIVGYILYDKKERYVTRETGVLSLGNGVESGGLLVSVVVLLKQRQICRVIAQRLVAGHNLEKGNSYHGVLG